MDGVKRAYTQANPPKEVHQAFLAFLATIVLGLVSGLVGIIFAAFIFSSISSATGGLGGFGVGFAVFGLIISLVIYAAVLFIMIQMRDGRNWARVTMAVLGGIALLFGVIGLFGGLFAFGLLGGVYSIVTLLIQLAQVGLVAAALYLMYRPSVASYFS